MNFDVLIVGAGPAGLAAGIAASSLGKKVCVLERNSIPGRKLLLSGSGQCNLTHGGQIADFLKHYGTDEKSRFVKPALFTFDNTATIRFFEQRGVALFERNDGKIFPKSLKSNDVLECLLAELKQDGGQLVTETMVKKVTQTGDDFLVLTEQGHFRTKKLILATGGQSYPATGSNGDGFHFAKQMGHSIVTPKPALTPIIVQNYPFADSAGTAFWSPRIEIRRDGKRVKIGQGDVLLTHHGLSGPGILNLSRFIELGDILFVNLIQNKEEETSEVFRSEIFNGKKNLKNALQPLGISERFLSQIFEQLAVLPHQPVAQTHREIRKRVESMLTGFPFVVEAVGNWSEAMVTCGGVAIEEVHRQTMESRLVPGLFFCGEILDIDGDTGGYNIQFALSSGFKTASLSTQQIAK